MIVISNMIARRMAMRFLEKHISIPRTGWLLATLKYLY